MDLRELRASPACAITDRNESANAISHLRTAANIANVGTFHRDTASAQRAGRCRAFGKCLVTLGNSWCSGQLPREFDRFPREFQRSPREFQRSPREFIARLFGVRRVCNEHSNGRQPVSSPTVLNRFRYSSCAHKPQCIANRSCLHSCCLSNLVKSFIDANDPVFFAGTLAMPQVGGDCLDCFNARRMVALHLASVVGKRGGQLRVVKVVGVGCCFGCHSSRQFTASVRYVGITWGIVDRGRKLIGRVLPNLRSTPDGLERCAGERSKPRNGDHIGEPVRHRLGSQCADSHGARSLVTRQESLPLA